MQPPAEPLFHHLTAFLSPLVPLETRLKWTQHGGTLATHCQVHDDDCNIDLWIANFARRHQDPFVPRLQALGVKLHDAAWIDACLASHRLVGPTPFSFPSLDLDTSPLAPPDTAAHAPATSPASSNRTPSFAATSSSRHDRSRPTAARSRTTTTTTAHEHDTPLTTAARTFKPRRTSSASHESSETIDDDVPSISDAEVERILLAPNGRSTFVDKLRATCGAPLDSDIDIDTSLSPRLRPHDGLSSSESQFADHEDLLDSHISTSSGTPSRALSACVSTANDIMDPHDDDEDAPSALVRFFAKPLAEQEGGPPVYDVDAFAALLQRQGAASRERVERVVHGEGGWTVRRRARGGEGRDEG
ncbi:hypothetical protein JCM9279_007082 [Rhodotorula babjevae]